MIIIFITGLLCEFLKNAEIHQFQFYRSLENSKNEKGFHFIDMKFTNKGDSITMVQHKHSCPFMSGQQAAWIPYYQECVGNIIGYDVCLTNGWPLPKQKAMDVQGKHIDADTCFFWDGSRVSKVLKNLEHWKTRYDFSDWNLRQCDVC